MKNGVLIYNKDLQRMDIQFAGGKYYGGLHCGECFDVLINNKWFPTRIEYGISNNNGWYLIDVDKHIDLQGLKVRK